VDDLPPFVLVHGGQHGGWCWRDVAARLRAAGATVYTPTLTGVGERSHLLSADVGLDTVIQDVVNVLEFEELDNAVLVGHSFGGMPVLGAADRDPKRIGRLVFLDAAVATDGLSTMDVIDDEVSEPWLVLSREQTGGLSLPLFFDAAASLGVTDPEARARLGRLLTPHPTRTYTDPISLANAPGNGLPATYVICDAPIFAALEAARQVARDAGWAIDTFPTGHDLMIVDPDGVADRLLAYARE
jgi:pimeloyl-ACP methyl ester carboxylesterase